MNIHSAVVLSSSVIDSNIWNNNPNEVSFSTVCGLSLYHIFANLTSQPFTVMIHSHLIFFPVYPTLPLPAPFREVSATWNPLPKNSLISVSIHSPFLLLLQFADDCYNHNYLFIHLLIS